MLVFHVKMPGLNFLLKLQENILFSLFNGKIWAKKQFTVQKNGKRRWIVLYVVFLEVSSLVWRFRFEDLSWNEKLWGWFWHNFCLPFYINIFYSASAALMPWVHKCYNTEWLLSRVWYLLFSLKKIYIGKRLYISIPRY